MKIRKFTREELNLTQDEMAIFLNVSRSQLSLYELGLRELSAMGSIMDSRASRYLLEAGEPKHFPEIEKFESDKNKFITEALKKNEIDQIAIKRKIDRMKKDYEAALKLFRLTDFTIQSKEYENNIHLAALQTLKAKAVVILGKTGPHQLIKLELRQKLVEQEKIVLNTMLR